MWSVTSEQLLILLRRKGGKKKKTKKKPPISWSCFFVIVNGHNYDRFHWTECNFASFTTNIFKKSVEKEEEKKEKKVETEIEKKKLSKTLDKFFLSYTTLYFRASWRRGGEGKYIRALLLVCSCCWCWLSFLFLTLAINVVVHEMVILVVEDASFVNQLSQSFSITGIWHA